MKVAYLTNAIPSYRADFFRRLLSETRFDVTVFCHMDSHGRILEFVDKDFAHKIKPFRPVRLPGGIAVFEPLPMKSIISDFDVVISDGNPRHLGFALVSSLAAILRRRVIIWSTLHSRRNRPLTQWFRLNWWRIFPEFMSYTTPDSKNLKARFKRKLVHPINNGLDQSRISESKSLYAPEDFQELKAELGISGNKVILSLGRALPGRFDMMVDVIDALRKRGMQFTWILLGDGAGMDALRASLAARGLDAHAILAGEIHDEALLAKWFGIADLFVYPEAIGLSLFHAFGYGLPVVIHSDRGLQGPEVAVFQDGETGLMFCPNDIQDMVEKIERLLSDDIERKRMGATALEIVEKHYNSEIMYKRFSDSLLLNKA